MRHDPVVNVSARPQSLDDAVSMIQAASGTHGRVRIVLGPEVVQRRQIRGLPPARRQIVRELVKRHSSRYFRSTRGPLVIDLAMGPKGQAGTWRGVAAEAEVLDFLVRAGANLGIEIVDIVPEPAPGWTALSLIPEGESRRRLRRHWLVTARLAAAVVVVTGLAWGLSFGIRSRSLAKLEQRLARTQEAVAAVEEAKRAYGRALELTSAIERARVDRRRLALTLAAVATALPDSAVLTSLALDLGGNAAFTGLAEDALAVNAALQQVTGLRKLGLDGAPTLEAAGDRTWMRFAISTRVGR